ncbi:hypothetical protein L2E82_15529 [Cichorium intybus]|uniref:Uncharacterized protein n=1 Tax=Cichorium intybus TaxID=13427 RepID=A0ACB9F3L5_CICIN|nr:hypothetical protein L2E82_15529 [Cichorium intybus]
MMPSSFPFILPFFRSRSSWWTMGFFDKRHENDRIHVYVDPFYEKLNDWIDEEAAQEVHEVNVEADYDAISSDSREYAATVL